MDWWSFYPNRVKILLMGSIIDDLEELEGLDKGGMLKILRGFPEDCRRAIKMAEAIPLGSLKDGTFKAVVFVGMGGSAIAGKLIGDWLLEESPIPMMVSKGYHVPGFVDEETLVFAVSYSGNTEETLSALREALDRGSAVISLTSGGSLERLSREKGLVLFLVPGGLRPRASLPYQFFMLATVLKRLGLIPGSWEEVDETIEVLEKLRDEVVPEVPADSNPAKKLALSLRNKVPFVYGPRLFEGVAYRFGTQLNENGKVPAASGVFPEVFHNAVLGCEGPDEALKPLSVLIIRDPDDPGEIDRKVDRFKALMEPAVGGVLEVTARGRGKLARMLSILYLGDYTSTYLGLLYGKDPSSMYAIEKLKRI
jgi:glucose/mannose-6-phosphate isomerase